MIFQNTDAQTDRHTIYHIQVQAKQKLCPVFIPLTKRSELAMLAHSVLFRINFFKVINSFFPVLRARPQQQQRKQKKTGF